MTIDRLLEVMARLRSPDGGCPWDREQTFATIVPFTIEEAYEVADAIDRGDLPALKDELGDLLFQVVFHARMAEEQGAFAFNDVVAAITAKLTRRHPHVFAAAGAIATPADQRVAWEEHKAAERQGSSDPSALAGIGSALPALMRAAKLGQRAARVGFDWESPAGVREKLAEELDELAVAEAANDAAAMTDELGDVLFTMANLARRLGVTPEEALRQANAKFERRFRAVEERVRAAGRELTQLDPAALDAEWRAVKATGL
jgi:tetrapyrrole methylase family protein/MazG family protein/ATP diphosphatase